MTPRTMRIAAAIHYHASQREWNMTLQELAEATGEKMATVRAIVVSKGWMSRLRTMTKDRYGLATDDKHHMHFVDLDWGQ